MMTFEEMSDEELKVYKQIRGRIKSLESKIIFLESEIPAKVVRDKLEATRLTLRANTEMLHFLFGEACLRQ